MLINKFSEQMFSAKKSIYLYKNEQFHLYWLILIRGKILDWLRLEWMNERLDEWMAEGQGMTMEWIADGLRYDESIRIRDVDVHTYLYQRHCQCQGMMEGNDVCDVKR